MTKSASSFTPQPAVTNDENAAQDDDDDDKDEDEDFGDAWAEMADDDADFLDPPLQPSNLPPATTAKNAVAANPFDDGGEPDFAGWLSAQQGGAASKKELPKGLAKKTPGAAAAGKSATVGGAKRAAPRVEVKKKVLDITPKAEDGDDDGWGDGW
jgi:SCY1-like protein 1